MAREKTGDAIDVATTLERRPYRRRDQAEWAEIRALYLRGATAKALAERFGGTERTLYTHLNKHGCLRKEQPAVECALDDGALDEAVRQGRGCGAEAPILGLAEDASLEAAARAAADRADALVWAVTDLAPGRGGAGPSVRVL